MATQDEIMAHILQLVREGHGAPLPPEVEAALKERYYNWIIKVPSKVKTTPQEVWDQEAGKKIQGQIRRIGKHLGDKKKPHPGKEDCLDSCIQVESLSECPHCPDPTGI